MIDRFQRRRGESGFTLIELLIVIIILGILAAIVVFAVGGSRKDAAQNSCKTNLGAVQLSAETFKTKNGFFPMDTLNQAAFDGSVQATLNTFYSQLTEAGTLVTTASLKNYPASGDYVIAYNPVQDAAQVALSPSVTNRASSYTVDLYPAGTFLKSNANGVVTGATTNAFTTAVTPFATGCSGLS